MKQSTLDGINRYVNDRCPVGSFLTAVLSNNLRESFVGILSNILLSSRSGFCIFNKKAANPEVFNSLLYQPRLSILTIKTALGYIYIIPKLLHLNHNLFSLKCQEIKELGESFLF